MHGSVVAEQEISTNEGTSTFLAFKRTLLRVCMMSILANEVRGDEGGCLWFDGGVVACWLQRDAAAALWLPLVSGLDKIKISQQTYAIVRVDFCVRCD